MKFNEHFSKGGRMMKRKANYWKNSVKYPVKNSAQCYMKSQNIENKSVKKCIGPTCSTIPSCSTIGSCSC